MGGKKGRKSGTSPAPTNPNEGQSWLPGERFTPRQLGLLLFLVLLFVAALFDLYSNVSVNDIEATNEDLLQAVYGVASHLPTSGAAFSAKGGSDVAAFAAAAQLAANALEELDTVGYPQVASSCSVVVLDTARSLYATRKAEKPVPAEPLQPPQRPDLSSKERETRVLELQNRIKACMAAGDMALHCEADEAHVALLLEAAEATEEWADLLATNSDAARDHVRHLRMNRAGLLEQAIVVRPQKVELRVKYSSALLELERFGEARQQLEHALRVGPKDSSFRPWVERLDALAVENGALGEYDAAATLRSMAEQMDGEEPPTFAVTSDGIIRAPLIDAPVVDMLTPP